MIPKIGAITIGQSPRMDIVPELRMLVQGQVAILEKGALDGLTLDQIKGLKPRGEDEVLITRLRDGTEVTVGRSYILPRLQERIFELAQADVSLIVLLCTGDFPHLRSEKPLIKPGRLLPAILSSISFNGTLGVLVPSQSQVPYMIAKYHNCAIETMAYAASPYQEQEALIEASEKLSQVAGLIVMDCLGYDVRMKETVKQITAKPVVLARSILAGAIRELCT